MKLKYYMRGVGIGIILTTLIFIISGYRKPINQRDEGTSNVEASDDALSDSLEEIITSGNRDEATRKSELTPAPTQVPTTPTQEPTQAPSPTNEPTQAPSPTQIPTPTQAPSPTNEPTKAPSPTQVPTPTQAPTPTNEPTQAPSPTQVPTPTQAPTPTNEPTKAPKPTQMPTPQPGSDKITITIKKGMSSIKVARLLEEEGLVEDAYDFNDYIVAAGKAEDIRIGRFTIEKGESYKKIVDKIT